METTKQLSVSLINKPGHLANMLSALNKEKIGFRALSVMDSGERGKVRFVPDDAKAAAEVLRKADIQFEKADVLLVEVPNQPGGFRKICERLASEHLNIDYAYCSFDTGGKVKGSVMAVIRVNNLTKAQRVLSANGKVVRRKLPQRRPVHAR